MLALPSCLQGFSSGIWEHPPLLLASPLPFNTCLSEIVLMFFLVVTFTYYSMNIIKSSLYSNELCSRMCRYVNKTSLSIPSLHSDGWAGGEGEIKANKIINVEISTKDKSTQKLRIMWFFFKGKGGGGIGLFSRSGKVCSKKWLLKKRKKKRLI